MQFTLIQQNDTHGCVEAHNELFWGTEGPFLEKAGGFSRIRQYVKKLKNEKENVLFFDGGDLFHGTLPLVASKGDAIVPILQKMELDGFVPGNWDYAYGKKRLCELTEKLGFSGLACNVYDGETGENFFKPYALKKLNGITVGVIGVTYPYVDITMPPDFSEGLNFTKGVEEVRESVKALEGQADVIVLLSHMGLPLDAKLVSLVDGIDIVLSGHSHDRVQKPIVQNGTYIVQAGSSSSFLGRLDVEFENGAITDIRYDLIVMGEQFEEDEEIKALVDELLSAYEKERLAVVGETQTLLHRMTLEEAPMDKLITDAYLSAFESDAAFSHGWRYGHPIVPGPVTLFDLHTIIPTNPELFLLELTGEELWNALEHNLEQVYSSDPFEQKGGYVLRSSGVKMTFKPYNPKSHRIQTLQIAGEPIQPEKTYRVAAGGSQSFKKHEDKKQYRNIHAIDVIQSFLQENGPYKSKKSADIVSV
ncbi:bifunctional metallophosphatase/5'-nucleotidase [Paenisporosarcina quisquiliarum]|uniref:Bifunctional metallophosphatase/5'-nucleotidase n=1 Tax=Paenisporosarcina quisquiliarum TaxID=365346 RepID=A0A9X3RDD7_9BACL|nr:bifunctional UDP-sugar hydrolase/5'-nucleotidase [Paenisporosarcina quisquiliarum]MCZ8537705.1 bifunctional metallophosphatase/5'-nucleotidase [Paenisporosarcina quisquiliarum]